MVFAPLGCSRFEFGADPRPKVRIISISRICILNQFGKEGGTLLAAFWFSDWKLSVSINRLIKSRPVEASSRIGFSAVAGDLFVADDAIGIVERGKTILEVEHQLFERFVLCVPERKDVAVQVDDLDTDGEFVENAKRFASDIEEGLTRMRALPDRAVIKVPEIVEVAVFRQDKVGADFFLSIAEDFQRTFQTARRVVNHDVLDGNQFVRKVGAGMINAFQYLAPVLQQRHQNKLRTHNPMVGVLAPPQPITIIDGRWPARILPSLSRLIMSSADRCAKHGSASDGRGTSCGIRSYSPAERRARVACTSTLRRPFPARPTATRRSRSGCIPSRGLLRGRSHP